LETENKQLQKDLDALEQYGRRSLIRISGLSERATGDETTTGKYFSLNCFGYFYNILFSYGHLL
jgi:hypothetical protein